MAIRVLTPLAANTAAPGIRDPWREELAAIVAVLVEPTVRTDLSDALIALANEMEKAIRLVWQQRDRFHRQWAASDVAIAQGGNVAAGSVAVDTVDRATAMDSARAAFIRRTQVELGNALREQTSRQASEQGARLAQAALDAERAVQRAEWEHFAPSGLNPGKELTSLLADSKLAQQLRTMGVRGIEAQWKGLLQFGKPDALDRFIDAASPFLDEVLRTPAPKLVAQRRDYEAGDVDRDRLMARKLLAEFDASKRARMPGDIIVASKALDRLRALYREICGNDVRFMSRSAFASRYLSDDAKPMPGWTEVDASFHVRRLPPADLGVPGWSAIVARDGDGNPIRRRPDVTVEQQLGMLGR